MVLIIGGARRHWHMSAHHSLLLLSNGVYTGRHSLNGGKCAEHELEFSGSRPDSIRSASERMVFLSPWCGRLSLGQRRFGWVSLGKYHSMYASRSRTAKASMYYRLLRQDLKRRLDSRIGHLRGSLIFSVPLEKSLGSVSDYTNRRFAPGWAMYLSWHYGWVLDMGSLGR